MECFNNYFFRTGNNLANLIPHVDIFLQFSYYPSVRLNERFSTQLLQVLYVINQLKKLSSPSTDCISVKILKAASTNLVTPHNYLQSLFSTGIVPFRMQELDVPILLRRGPVCCFQLPPNIHPIYYS